MNVGLRRLTGKERAGAAGVDWAAVYAEQLPRVYNYFRFKVGHGPLAEDLTAQTFERAWRGRARYRHDLGAFSTWLFTIARNVAISHFRRGEGRDLPLERFVARSAGATLEEAFQRRSDLARLRLLLAELPERDRELIELKYGADLTNRAIAKLTGLSESNVGTILHRVVRRLRAAWEEARE
jgi:RNA polymerase sigma-70 factor (ECF subfamily)